jgi:hypothetical protein
MAKCSQPDDSVTRVQSHSVRAPGYADLMTIDLWMIRGPSEAGVQLIDEGIDLKTLSGTRWFVSWACGTFTSIQASPSNGSHLGRLGHAGPQPTLGRRVALS